MRDFCKKHNVDHHGTWCGQCVAKWEKFYKERKKMQFDNNNHPALKIFKKMKIKDIATVAHYFGMAVVPQVKMTKLLNDVNKVLDKKKKLVDKEIKALASRNRVRAKK